MSSPFPVSIFHLISPVGDVCVCLYLPVWQQSSGVGLSPPAWTADTLKRGQGP